MRGYIKPVCSWVELRTEERFATGSGCTITGSCDEATKKYMASIGQIVNQD